MDTYAQIAERIIEAQEAIIGPVAVEQAQMVANLRLDWESHTVSINGNELDVIDNLVSQYSRIFGQTSVEVCREAAASLLRDLPTER